MQPHLNKNINMQPFKTNVKNSVHPKLKSFKQKQPKPITSATHKQQLANNKEHLHSEHYVQFFLLS